MYHYLVTLFVRRGSEQLRSFYIYSKPLIERIQSVAHFPEIKTSCLLKGKKIGSIPAISFSLHDMAAEEEGGYHDEGPAENGSGI